MAGRLARFAAPSRRLLFVGVDDERVFGTCGTWRLERRLVQDEQLRLQRLGTRLLRPSRPRVHLVNRVQHARTSLEAHETEVAAKQDLAGILQRLERVLMTRGECLIALYRVCAAGF